MYYVHVGGTLNALDLHTNENPDFQKERIDNIKLFLKEPAQQFVMLYTQ